MPNGGRTRRCRARKTSGSASMNSPEDRKSTRLNSSHANISYAVFCLKKKKKKQKQRKKRRKEKKKHRITMDDSVTDKDVANIKDSSVCERTERLTKVDMAQGVSTESD